MKKMSAVGRLTQDPQIKNLGSKPAAVFTVAANTRRKDESGNYIANFLNCVVFSNVREACAQNLRKGSAVFVMGDHNIRSYKDANGLDRFSEELTVTDIQFLDPRNAATTQGAPAGGYVKTAVPASSVPEGDDDELPF